MSGSKTMSYERVKKSSLVDFHYDLAQVFIKQKHWQKAMEACSQIIKLDPHFVPAYQSLAELLMRQEDWDGAIDYYRKAIELNPNLTNVHHSLGFALSKQQKWNEAVEALKQATELNPDFSWSHNSLGEALLHLGRWKEAVIALRKAIELNPNFAWSHYNLGDVLVELEDWDGAVSAYQRAMELKENLPNIQTLLGNAIQQKSSLDIERALSCYLEEIKHNPENEEAYLKALELKADDPELYMQYGNTLLKKNRTEEAVLAYHIAIKIQPHNTEFHLKLASNLIEKGEVESAIDCYRQALEFNPDSELIQIALEKALVQKKQKIDSRKTNYNQELDNLTVSVFNSHENSTAPITYGQNKVDYQLKPELNIKGSLEEIDGCLLRGWAYNSLNPDESLTLIFYQNDQAIFEVVADKFRDDLQELGIGTGHYGFAIRLPLSICKVAPFLLKVKVKGSDFILRNANISFKYKPTYKQSFQGNCEPCVDSSIKGWALDNSNLENSINIYVYEDHKFLCKLVANKYRSDIHDWKKGHGYYGYKFDLTEELLDNKEHKLHFCFENSAVELDNSPILIEEGYALPLLLNSTHKKLTKVSQLSDQLGEFF